MIDRNQKIRKQKIYNYMYNDKRQKSQKRQKLEYYMEVGIIDARQKIDINYIEDRY